MPGILGDLRLQLPRTPPGIAREDPGASQAAQRLGVALLGEEADRVEREDPGPIGVLEIGEHHGGLRLHGPSAEEGFTGGDQRGEGWRGFLHGRVERLVQHHPDGALVVMVADEHHRPPDRGWQVRTEARANISQPPSAYLRRFYYDCIVYTESALRVLIDTVGADRVVFGTDWPYDMALDWPVSWILAMESLTQAEKEAILWRNLERLLGI